MSSESYCYSNSNFEPLRNPRIISLVVYVNTEFQNTLVTLFTKISNVTYRFTKRLSNFVSLRKPCVLLYIFIHGLNLISTIPILLSASYKN